MGGIVQLAGPRAARVACWMLAGLCFALVLKCAWVCDDAYITMRTVDNVVGGLGPRWNPDERVQAYTHPLWMLVLCVPYACTHAAYSTLLATSLSFTGIFLASLLLLHARRWRGTALALLVLCASKSFVDFSTSGLENPLIHLLLALAYALLWDGPRGLRGLFALALLSALGAVTRPDALLLFLPALFVRGRTAFREQGVRRASTALAAGLAPWLAWLAFSLVYYGDLVPNSAHAKLGAGLSLAERLRQSADLLVATSIADPAALLALGLAAWLALRPSGRALRPALVAIAAWQLYLCWAGGDFMLGRVYTPVLVLAALVLARSELPGKLVLAAAAFVVAIGALSPISPWRTGADYGPGVTAELPFFRERAGRGDERAAYFRYTGLFRAHDARSMSHPWAELGRELKREAGRRDIKPFLAWPIGMVGFHAGPEVKIIDRLALADPLLARLPMQADETWLVQGHYPRSLPAGYRASRWKGGNRIQDADLARYHESLRRVVTGELWSRERMRAIWSIHFGEAREHLERYRERYVRREVELDSAP